MTLSNARASFGLNVTAEPTSQGVSGTLQIGASNQFLRLTNTEVAYELRAVFAGSSDVLAIDFSTGSTAGSTTWVAGVAQVETATAAGTITLAGNATAIVTSAGMSGSPRTVTFAVALSDTPTLWAVKARAALAADIEIAGRFAVSGSGTAIILTRLPYGTFTVPGGTLNTYVANDATLNIALADATSAGITEAATSANTTAGVASDGVKIYDGDGKDFEGIDLVAMTPIFGLLIQSETGIFDFSGTISDQFRMQYDQIMLRAASDVGGVTTDYNYAITCTEAGALTITVFGQEVV